MASSHHHHDLNKRAAYIHVLADAATSVLAILALTGGMLWGAAWLDPVMGLVGAVVILVWARGLLRDTASILVDAHAAGNPTVRIRSLLAEHQVTLHDLHVWQVGEQRYAVIVSIGQYPQLAHLRQHISALPGVAHLTLESAES